MDASCETESTQNCDIPEQPIPAALVTVPRPTFQRLVQHCFEDSIPGEFPLAANPSIVLHILTTCNLEPQDLAKLETTCCFFRQPANFSPDRELAITELAALNICEKRAMFKPMTAEQRDYLKQKCGGSWKLVLKYLLAGEACCRRGKSQAIAGPGHSIVVTSNGAVYFFGMNESGQLGHGNTTDECRPRMIRSLQGIRIIEAAVGVSKTMLISDTGKAYAFGKDSLGEVKLGNEHLGTLNTPQPVELLQKIFVVQAVIADNFTAVLSREGSVYIICRGCAKPPAEKLYPLLGPLENIPVVQITAGSSHLLALASLPNGMSVYWMEKVHGGMFRQRHQLIEQFQTLNFQPMVVAASNWHSAAVSKDGRVCTWGMGYRGCLGHGDEEHQSQPKVVEGLSDVKAVDVSTGSCSTFVLSDNGDVYSFGLAEDSSLGLGNQAVGQGIHKDRVVRPELVSSLKQLKERVVQITSSKSIYQNQAHTFALTESGRIYAFGAGDKGQLGVKLKLCEEQTQKGIPELVDIDLDS